MKGDTTSRDAGAAISGDARALERLWRDNRRWTAAVVMAHKPRDAELEDLLQDIAMTLVRKIHDLRDPARFRPWLRRIAVNAARTAGRRRTVRLRLVRPAIGSAGGDASREAVAQEQGPNAGLRDEGKRLLDLAQRLHPDYREPLLLHCLRGMSHKQIAAVLDLPVTTIETRVARARKMLREEADFENQASGLRVTRAAADE